jgi:hypothetical protein
MKTRLLILVLALLVFAAPAMAEQRTQGLTIQRTTPANVPQGGFGGVPQQNLPGNSVTQSAAEQQKKMEELQRVAACQKKCKQMAYSGANNAMPYCMNGQCAPNSPNKKKWLEKYDFYQKLCRKQSGCE